jgi:hypothetical protein
MVAMLGACSVLCFAWIEALDARRASARALAHGGASKAAAAVRCYKITIY